MRFGLISDLITAQLRLIRMLRGLTPDFTSFNDAEFDEARFEQHLESNPALAIAASRYWIRKLQACVYAGDCASAVAAASNVAPLLWTVPSQFELRRISFLRGTCSGGTLRHRPRPRSGPGIWKRLAAHHRQLTLWAENCPENFANRAALVGAEIARLEGRELDAMRLYEEAIRLGARARLHPERGLGNELAARFYAARGFETIAARLSAERTVLLSALGRRRQGAAARATPPAPPRESGSASADRHHRRTRRAAGRRHRGQGFAGGVGRDRTRQAHRNPDDDRDSSMPAPSVACSSFSRATSRGSWRRPPPATAESRSRFERQP